MGLIINPSIPSHWKELSVVRKFRGKTLNIKINNPDALEKGVKQISLNGNIIEGNEIPADNLENENEVIVNLG